MVYTISGIRFPVLPSLQNSTLRGADRRTSSSHSFLLNKKNYSSFSRTSLYAKFSRDSETKSSTIAESDKVLIPEDQDDSASVTDQLENPDITTEDAQNLEDLTMKDGNKYNLDDAASSYREVGDAKGSVVSSSLVDVNTDAQVKKTSVHSDKKVKIDKPKIIPPPGTGQKIYEIDPFLEPYRQHLDFRYGQYKKIREEIDKYEGGLDAFSRGYEKLGFTRSQQH
jgi:1,4-alpha-glucan branching enzyme